MSQEIDRAKRHDIDAIDRGLVYLALNYGKARKASRAMKEDGLDPIPAATLDYWKKVSHCERYEQLRQEMEQRRDLNAAERMDALVNKALDLEEKILDQTAKGIGQIAPRDLPNAYKNLAIGSGVLQDKSNIIRNKPTEIVQRGPSFAELEYAIAALMHEDGGDPPHPALRERALQGRAERLGSVEGEAEDITDAIIADVAEMENPPAE